MSRFEWVVLVPADKVDILSEALEALEASRAAVQRRARRAHKGVETTNPHKVSLRAALVEAEQHDRLARRAHAIVVLNRVARVVRVRDVEAEHVQRQVVHLRDGRRVLDARGEGDAVELQVGEEGRVVLRPLAVAAHVALVQR